MSPGIKFFQEFYYKNSKINYNRITEIFAQKIIYAKD